MNIRSITTLLNPGWPLEDDLLEQAGKFNVVAKAAIIAEGFEVQTTRLGTIPFPQLVDSADETVNFSQQLEKVAIDLGFEYVCIGPADSSKPETFEMLPGVFAATENVFASGTIADHRGVSLPSVRAAAEVMVHCAKLEENGFGNLYFAALANVPPGGPFFPAAYHEGDQPAFGIATESADLAVMAFSSAGTLAEARQNLIESIEAKAALLAAVSERLASESGLRFNGIDFTLAPFPEQQRSIGEALERLGLPGLGYHGSLAAAAFLVDTLAQANYPKTGFNGLFQPVLEDAILARRAAEGHLTITDLLLYSTVCGTGLDTVPLPGDTTVEQLTAVLLDLASLSARLHKPLTARLMPMPGKKAGDKITFDFPFFADSRVMELRAAPLKPPLSGDEVLDLSSRV